MPLLLLFWLAHKSSCAFPGYLSVCKHYHMFHIWIHSPGVFACACAVHFSAVFYHKCHSSHFTSLFPMWFFNRNSVLNFLPHMWQSDSFFLWYCLKCLLKPISSQKTLPQSWQVVFSLMFIVHAPQVCDILKNFHFWCRIEHFYFLAGMLPQLD